ncbi:MAG: D-alanine--D-alanine ligase [Bacilli bacterium]|nr:D-alanine--D-alanine ligase [Bacilli bacterium]
MKLNVGVIFGGKSLEHEMSVITAIQAMDNIDTEKYEIIPIYITKDREWYTGGALRFIDTYKDLDLLKRYTKKVNLINKNGRYILQKNGLIKKEINELHLAFPMMHGTGGEDGTIQGYLNIIGIPYVGSNIFSAAVSQDKAFVKQILKTNDIPILNFVWFGERFYRNKKEELFKQIDELKYPLILKPATLGSSIGIEIIKQKEEIDSTIERSFKIDTKIIIEELIEDFVEYDCSVLLTPDGNITSEIEEITTNKEIRSYGDKFIYEDTDESSIKRTCPTKITDKLRKQIEFYSLSVFKILNMRGTARVDFLYDKKENKLYVNEVNCIPFCFAHHLWEARNISYKELLNILLKDAIDNEVKLQQMTLTMDSDILKKMTNRTIKEMK